MTYCERLVNPKSACDQTASGQAYHNAADYRGAGRVSVCEKAVSGNQTLSRRCNIGYVNDGQDLESWQGFLMILYAGNDDDQRHTIYGAAEGLGMARG